MLELPKRVRQQKGVDLNAEHAIPLFPTDEIPRILDMLLRHAARLRKKHETEREDVISDRLFKLLRKDKMLRAAPFVPVREHQIFDNNTQEGHSGRIDINFVCLPGDETYFAIEAKRLHVNFPSGWKSLVSEYVAGEQGMMCFINGKYSRFQPSAAMLGYVFDGNVSKARTGIAASVLKNAGVLRLVSPHQLQRSKVVPSDRVDETRHFFGSRQFTIYHLLVSI